MKIFQELIDNGLIKEEKIEFTLTEKVIKKARRGIKSSVLLFNDRDFEGSYELAGTIIWKRKSLKKFSQKLI
jgi:hypothetical protein